MRWIVLVLCLLTRTLSAQEIEVLDVAPTSKTPAEGETWGERIGVGAERAYSELQARLQAEQKKVQELEAELVSLRYQLRLSKQPEPTKETRLKFTMVTATDCEACPLKLLVVKPWAEKAGYIFENENHPQMRGGTYPRYRVCWGDYCEEFNSPVEQLGEAVADRLRRWGVAFKRGVTVAPRKRWGINEGHYTPSVKGMTIEYHLTEQHNVDVTGMTLDQMEREHQRLHGN